MKRKLAVTFLVGAGLGLSGCQSPMLGGMSFWKGSGSSIASTAPDVSRQKYSGLSQQVASDQPRAMGAGPAPNNDGVLLASWKKTTAAVTGAMTPQAKPGVPEDDPLRLDKLPKKIGPDVYVGAARLLENQGKFAEAELKYQEALKSSPGDMNTLVGLARLHDRQGQTAKAIETYNKAAQTHPTEAIVFNDLGLCHRRQRQFDKSVVAFKKAVDLQPENAKYRNNLAAALVDAGKLDDAYQELAVANPPAVAHYNLAYLLQQKGDRGAATKHLQQALQHDSGLSPAREMLAQLSGTPAKTSTPTEIAPATRAPAAMPLAAAPMTIKEPTQPAPLAVAQLPDASLPYASNTVESAIHTAPPQIVTTPAPIPPSYHIGDDSSPPPVETAQNSKWGSAAWALPSSNATAHPLPPVE